MARTARRLFTGGAQLAAEQPVWRYCDAQGAVQVRIKLSVCGWRVRMAAELHKR